ncbi:CMRF35-like molecule 1 [Enoplosus armatus]|uniref:CMRF35-like molecule 1 n=1 Tax=Enoplosus armatus TaxID=215367 RepID=UPI003992B0CE
MGIHSEYFTVSKVSVKAGGSISIPCLYEPLYRNHVKYLCEGYFWVSCSYAVKTDKPDNSGTFSISDATNQRIFTVTINNLPDKDTHYWCAVELKNQGDVKHRFQLSVATGVPSLYVEQQEITAFEGGSVTVMCHHKYTKVTNWCRLGSTCVTGQTGSIEGTTVTINASVPNVFNVTMSELRTESSGWYWCATGDLQMPVHITVNESTSTTTTTMSPGTSRTLPTATQHSSLFTSTEPHTAQPTNSTLNGAGGESLQDEHSSAKMTILITTLTVLHLLVVVAAFFGWRMIRRNKTKPEGPDITAGSQTGSNPDVLYATIVHDQHVAAQKKSHVPEESVTYSTIVMKDIVPQMTEPAEGSVICSTLHSKI